MALANMERFLDGFVDWWHERVGETDLNDSDRLRRLLHDVTKHIIKEWSAEMADTVMERVRVSGALDAVIEERLVAYGLLTDETKRH